MIISMIVNDNTIMRRSGDVREFLIGDLSPLRTQGIHAVQWNEDHGHVEYRTHNEQITSFAPFQKFVDAAKPPPEPEPPPLPPEPEIPILPPGPPMPLSRRQFYQILAMQSLITTDEALAAVQHGAIPHVFETVLQELPPDQQFAARMLLAGASEFQIDHPLVDKFAEANGLTEDEVEQLWKAGAAL